MKHDLKISLKSGLSGIKNKNVDWKSSCIYRCDWFDEMKNQRAPVYG